MTWTDQEVVDLVADAVKRARATTPENMSNEAIVEHSIHMAKIRETWRRPPFNLDLDPYSPPPILGN